MDGRDTFDVFLSYNSSDHAAVLQVAETLRARGLQPYLDRWSLAAGRPWLPELEDVLRRCRSAAIFIGPQGLGRIQQRERELAILRQASEPTFPVIPVLLSGIKPADLALGFLALNTWVDLRQGVSDSAIAVLVAGMKGQPPGPDVLADIQKAKSAICPYRGLHYFREEDAPFFHGRDAFVRSLIETTGRFPFVAVVGPSGSGKSSVVRAGLVPELRRREGNRTETWDIITMLPAAEPLKSLAYEMIGLLQPELSIVQRREAANELAGFWRKGSTTIADSINDMVKSREKLERTLLVVDQWEELYTSCEDQEVRSKFIAGLLEASERSPVKIVMTVRADFFGKVLEDRALRDRIEQAVVTLAPMNRDELRRAMEEPAKSVGLMFEEHLADEILDDVGNEPGGLPLLEFVLEMLWERRRGHELTHDAYWEIGKIQGAIAKRADEEFKRLPMEQQRIARRALVRLVNPGEGREDTRRRADLDELGANAADVVKTLTARRLLVTGRDAASGKETVEVTHEALIQRWPTLKEWVDQDRTFLRSYKRVKEDADDWEEHGKDASLLLPAGRRLEEGRDLLKTHADDIEPIRDYISESIRVSDRRVRQKQNRARLTAAVFAALALVAGGLALYGFDQSHKARQAATTAQTSQSIFLAEKSQQQTDEGNPEAGVLLALAALPIVGTESEKRPFVGKAEMALYSALGSLHETVPLEGHTGAVNSAAFSSDGTRLVTASSDKTARVWDVAGRMELAVLQGHEGAIRSASFSPDGTRIVTASEDNTARVWDVAGRKELMVLEGHEDIVFSAAFSPDGSTALTASNDDTARLWDAESGKQIAVLRHDDDVLSAAFSPDGRKVVTTSYDMTAKLWDAASGAELHMLSGHEADVTSAVFNPDGTKVATISVDNTARLWDAASGDELAVLRGHTSWIDSIAFSPDGSTAITTSADHTARLWDLTNTPTSILLGGHGDEVTSGSFNPDGTVIATASKDKTLRLWDAKTGKSLTVLRGDDDAISSVKFSPDGKNLVTTCPDGMVRLWAANTALELAVLRSHEANVYRAYFSPDGAKLATISADKTARIWDVPSGKELRILKGHAARLKSADFNRDGTKLVTASDDGTARLWDVGSGRELLVMDRHKGWVNFVAFSPDGREIATASQDGTARLWDGDSGKEVRVLGGHQDIVYSLAFSPDGRTLLTASADRTARLWDVATGQELAVLKGHEAGIYWAIFDSSGSMIATASADKTARLWNAKGEELQVLKGHEDEVVAIAFSPDDQRLVTTSKDKTARIWQVDDGKELQVLRGHDDGVKWASFDKTGTLLATASADGTARLWELPSGQPLAVLRGHGDDVYRAMFSPDGSMMATASDDGTVRLWKVASDLQSFIEYAQSVTHRGLTPTERTDYGLNEKGAGSDRPIWQPLLDYLHRTTGL